jgi:predicted dinucleotide-binding enzyme
VPSRPTGAVRDASVVGGQRRTVLASPVPDGGKRVVFISSDHEDASAEVASLAEKLGFAPIEVGKIGESGRLIQARYALVFQDQIKLGAK